MKNKILTALLAVAIALGLWLYVVTVVSPNSDRQYHNVEVTLQGESILQERGLMIVTEKLPTVSLHLGGNRTDLDKLNGENITLTVDVSKIGEAGVHNLRFTPSYPGDVTSSAVTVLSQNPVAVSIEVEERISKPVPVDLQYSGNLAADFMADKENVILEHTSIQVTGPKSVVDTIATARIDLSLEGRIETVNDTFSYTLCDEQGQPVTPRMVTTNTEDVAVTLRIVRVKEIELLVDVVYGGGATEQNTKVEILPGTIRISGSENLTEEIESLNLGTITLADIPEDTELTFPITLPEGITNETGVTEAKVSISFQDLDTKTVTVDKIQAVNVPAGLEADLITQVLEINLRGPKDKLADITAENVKVTVDFTDIPTGTATVKANIEINVDGIGAMGAYQVAATLRQKAAGGARTGTAG